MLAVAHAGRGGRSTSSWVAGCAGLDDGYTEWVNQGLPVAVGHPPGADRAVSDGWAPRLAGSPGFYIVFTWFLTTTDTPGRKSGDIPGGTGNQRRS